ncbi:MAG TPA: hypothetical protein VHD91_10700 [Gaiellaceae bacterium]|nr:hypothetical protein [Gaiellaceae bacterium]
MKLLPLLAIALALPAAALAAAPPPVAPATHTVERPAGAADSDLVLLSPEGPTVNAQKFTIVLHSDTLRQKLRLEQGPTNSFSTPDANGSFHFAEKIEHGGTYDFTAYIAGDQTFQVLLRFSLGVQPTLYAIQSLGSKTTLMAPGCSVCHIRDPRGDTKGGPPDLASFDVSVANGWITFRVTAYDGIRFGDRQIPCVEGSVPTGGSNRFFFLGCSTASGIPHTGRLVGGCVRPDRNHECGAVRTSFPDSRTVMYRIRAQQLGKPSQIAVQAWILYAGDRLMDTIPNVVHLGNAHTTNCFVILQLRKGVPGDYEFGKSECSQAVVGTAKP